MSTIVREDTILKLHTDATSAIWRLDGNGTPARTAAQLQEFADRDFHGRRVRVLGVPANAQLLLLLFSKKIRGELLQLEVAGPCACESVGELQDPEVTLFRMRQHELAPSLGGWHDFTELDYPSYALIHQLQCDGGVVSEHARRLLRVHPAWYDLQFVNGVDPVWACKLLATIVDPRWYVDLEHPDRVSRLESFLGLNPRVQSAASDGRRQQDTLHQRCLMTLRTWYPADGARPSAEDPRNFLWRLWHKAGGGIRGDLRASQSLIAFLHHTWVQSLCAHKPYLGRLFRCEDFFKDAAEIAAYRQYASRRPVPV